MARLLNASDILHIYDRVVEATGGSLGLREPGMLAAIADKPRASFGGENLYLELEDKAAAIFEALCNYHVFVDGNKRTAITCLEYFLHLNGRKLTANMAERERYTVKVATSRPDLASVAAWIKRHTAAI